MSTQMKHIRLARLEASDFIPSKIKCHYDADTFFYFLQNYEHLNVSGMEFTCENGITVIYHTSVWSSYQNKSIEIQKFVDHDFIWNERKSINDWIDRFQPIFENAFYSI